MDFICFLFEVRWLSSFASTSKFIYTIPVHFWEKINLEGAAFIKSEKESCVLRGAMIEYFQIENASR